MGEFTDKAKGKAKRLEGRITGDRTREQAGRIDEAKGDVKGVLRKIKETTHHLADVAKQAVTNGKRNSK